MFKGIKIQSLRVLSVPSQAGMPLPRASSKCLLFNSLLLPVEPFTLLFASAISRPGLFKGVASAFLPLTSDNLVEEAREHDGEVGREFISGATSLKT